MTRSSAARVTPAARPGGRPAPQARLRVVAAGHSRVRMRLAVLCIGLLGGGLVLLLLLNISLSRGSYELYQRQAQQNLLAEQVQSLQEDLLAEQAPQTLAARARTLGMVPAPNPAFVRIGDGKVLGAATPAPVPSPTAAPKPNTAPKPTAAPTRSAPASKSPTHPHGSPAAGSPHRTPAPTRTP